jgi:hypothetical protein
MAQRSALVEYGAPSGVFFTPISSNKTRKHSAATLAFL